MRRMHDLGVELHAVAAVLHIFIGRCGRFWCRRRNRCANRRHGDGVEVAHPDRLRAGLCPTEQHIVSHDSEFGASVFTAVSARNLATKIAGEQLCAVANTQNRNTEFVHTWVDRGSALDVHRSRATRKDDSYRVLGSDLCSSQIVADDFREHMRFTHAARNELCVLRAEIDDKDGAYRRFSVQDQ